MTISDEFGLREPRAIQTPFQTKGDTYPLDYIIIVAHVTTTTRGLVLLIVGRRCYIPGAATILM